MSKIIVGVDLSAPSERAVAHAVDVARRLGAEVVLVVVDLVPDLAELGSEAVRAEAARDPKTLAGRLHHNRAALAALRDRWLGHGVELSQLVVDGFADERLPAVAEELGADLIVVGSHGRTGLNRFLLGSVAERVIRRADRSVLLARGDAPDGGYRRAVIGTDFSEPAELALARAVPLIARGGRIELVHCWQAAVLSVFGEPLMVSPGDELQRAVGQSLRELGARFRATALIDRPDVELVLHAECAPPAQGLVDLAAARAADLVVVGSHGRRGVRRFVKGSVAERTAHHVACSILVAR